MLAATVREVAGGSGMHTRAHGHTGTHGHREEEEEDQLHDDKTRARGGGQALTEGGITDNIGILPHIAPTARKMVARPHPR